MPLFTSGLCTCFSCSKHNVTSSPKETFLLFRHDDGVVIFCCWLVTSYDWLFGNPMDCSPPGSSVHEIFQARILEWVAISFSRGSGIQPMSPALAGGFFTTEIFFFLKSPYLLKVKVLATQSCLTLCDSMDCCPPGSSIHGILQARILEWVALPFSRESSQPGNQTQVSHIACRFFILIF